MQQIPIEISWRGMTKSPILQAMVHRQVKRLAKRFDRITRCTVVIERETPYRDGDASYKIRVHLGVPRKELMVNLQSDHQRRSSLQVLLTDAFGIVRRQLTGYREQLTQH